MAKETYYAGETNTLCEDGVKRTVYVKRYRYDGSFAADTWFSTPARVRVSGKWVTGYYTHNDNNEPCFRAFLYRKNHALIDSLCRHN